MPNMTVTQLTLQQAGDEARQNVAGNLRLLRRLTGNKVEDIANAVGMSRASLHAKMATEAPTSCTADQVAQLAAFFGVPVEVLYASPEETVRRLPDLGIAVSTCNHVAAA